MSRVPVYVRVRPINRREQGEGACEAWHLGQSSLQCALEGKDQTQFTVGHVFEQHSSTREVYDAAAKGIVAHALQGYSGTIFAYGQTSSGKTHTMTGDGAGGSGIGGIVQLALDDMWQQIEQDAEADYIVQCMALEVYNEHVIELHTRQELRIVEGKGKDPQLVYTRGGVAQAAVVSSAQEAAAKVQEALRQRQIAETNMNATSSRSHTIIRVQIDRMPKGRDDGERTRSLLHLVDLAGSESMKTAGASGTRAREGSKINKSLSALVRVIYALSSGRAGSRNGGGSGGGNAVASAHQTQHVPFRDSNLTRLLRTSLGGNTKTAIVCCVTAASTQYEQTASTLRFAQAAAKVRNDPKKCVITEGVIPPALRETLQNMAAAQTAEAREQHRREVTQLMDEMERLREEQERHKTQIEEALEHEREKRVAAENALQQHGSGKHRSPGGGTPAPKRARLQSEVDRLQEKLREAHLKLEREHEKRVAAENALQQHGRRKRRSPGGGTPARKRARRRSEVKRLREELREAYSKLEEVGTEDKDASMESASPATAAVAAGAAEDAAGVEHLEQQVQELHSQLESLQETLTKTSRSRDAARSKVASLNSDLKKQNSTVRQLVAEVQQLQADKEAALQQKQQLQHEAEMMQQREHAPPDGTDEEGWVRRTVDCVQLMLQTAWGCTDQLVTCFPSAAYDKCALDSIKLALRLLIVLVEHGGEAVMPYLHDIFAALVHHAKLDEHTAHAAAYGIGLCAEYAARFREHPSSPGLPLSFIGLSSMVLVHISRIRDEKWQPAVCKAVSALLKISRCFPEQLPEEQVLLHICPLLPVAGDNEAKIVHRHIFCDALPKLSALAVGPNGEKMGLLKEVAKQLLAEQGDNCRIDDPTRSVLQQLSV